MVHNIQLNNLRIIDFMFIRELSKKKKNIKRTVMNSKDHEFLEILNCVDHTKKKLENDLI